MDSGSLNTPQWRLASAFATRAHDGQVRRDGFTPYIVHPHAVAMTVRHIFGCDDELTITIALLHDTIEDTTVDYDDLLETFGPEVAQGVAALTKDDTLPEPAREVAYDERLATADWRARLVKLADVHDNLLDADTPERITRALRKCARALRLAEADDHPATHRAIHALTERLANH